MRLAEGMFNSALDCDGLQPESSSERNQRLPNPFAAR
jgi:hypothetical protein